MKYLKPLYFFLLIIISYDVLAQNPNKYIYVKGVVHDSLTDLPIEYVSVGLFSYDSSKVVTGTLTDKFGSFTIKISQKGNFKIIMNLIGYDSRYISNVLLEKDNIDLGIVKISLKNKELDEIKVSTLKNNIEHKYDKVVYNISNSDRGETTLDILKKVPFISVDMNGSVKIRDEDNIKILLNGRPSNISIRELKGMTGNMLKSIEVITSPSAKYDADGVGGLINIVIKKDSDFGLNGSGFLTVGTRSNVLGADIFVRNNKYLIINNLSGTYDRLISGYDFIRNNFSNSYKYILNQTSESLNQTFGVNENLSIDYQATPSTFFNFGIKVNSGESKTDNYLKSYLDDSKSIKNLDSKILTNNSPFTFSINTDFVKTFKNPENNISVYSSYSLNRENTSSLMSPDDINSKINWNKNFNSINNKEFTIQVDYVKPLEEKKLLELGGKFINRVYESQYNYEVLDKTQGYIKDSTMGNILNPIEYNQSIFSLYSSFTIPLNEKNKLRLGARFENTRNNFLININQTYNNILPNILISSKVNSTLTLRFTYNNRLQRPSIYYLNPFIDNTDPSNVRVGNANLLPENSHSFEFSYNKLLKKGSFAPYIFLRFVNGIIQPIRKFEESISKTVFENVGQSSNLGFGYSIGLPIGGKTNINSFGSLSRYEIVTPFLSSQSGIVGNVGVNLSVRFNAKMSFDGSFNFSSSKIYAQGRGNLNYFNSFSFRYKVNNKSRLTLILDNPISEKVKSNTSYFGDDFTSENNRYYIGRAIRINYFFTFGYSNTNRSKKNKGIDNDDTKGKDDGLFVK